MRMIAEYYKGCTYVCFETEKNFLKNERTRKSHGMVRVTIEQLNKDCYLPSYGPRVYVVSPKLSKYNYNDSKQSPA